MESIILIWIFMIIIFIGLFIFIKKVVSNSNNEKKNKYLNKGYHFINICEASYKGGIKNISVHNDIIIDLLKEGLNFNSKTCDKTILFKNVTDITLNNRQYIENQVSLGNLIVFGVLAFGMDKKQNSISDEYIVLNVKDEDGEYNVFLQSYEMKDNQSLYNKLLNFKNRELLNEN